MPTTTRTQPPDYFISHVDLTRIAEYRAEAAKLTGVPSIALLFRHLSASRLVTVAQIEGRVRAAGSEFVLACDMRFAAREVMLSAEDYDADLAERYGWINRALPAAELRDFVRSLAHRIAGFPAAGLAAVKERVNAISLAPTEDFRRDSDRRRGRADPTGAAADSRCDAPRHADPRRRTRAGRHARRAGRWMNNILLGGRLVTTTRGGTP
jgi:enoyl-CoA hydratase/carnithine racemase